MVSGCREKEKLKWQIIGGINVFSSIGWSGLRDSKKIKHLSHVECAIFSAHSAKALKANYVRKITLVKL